MRYRDVTTAADRFRLPASHPILARITIDAADWHLFNRLVGDTPITKIVGQDDAHDGWLTVNNACASEETRRRLEDGWG